MSTHKSQVVFPPLFEVGHSYSFIFYRFSDLSGEVDVFRTRNNSSSKIMEYIAEKIKKHPEYCMVVVVDKPDQGPTAVYPMKIEVSFILKPLL